MGVLPTVIVYLEQEQGVAKEVLIREASDPGERLHGGRHVVLTYAARTITVGTNCAISPPTKLHASPTSQITTNRTLRPCPDCKV